MLGNLKNAFVWKDSLATKFFMWTGRIFYQAPNEFDHREFWAVIEDRSVPKLSDISQANVIKERIKLNRFRFMFISHFGRWLPVLTGVMIVAASIVLTILTVIKHFI